MNEEKIKEILEENAKLKEELQAIKKYTAPASRKVYYEHVLKFRLSPLQIIKRKRKKLDHRR
jgi:hypothetical protein